MSRKRKRTSLVQTVGILGLVGLAVLGLLVGGLLLIASQFGLDPQAFVLAALAGLVVLVLYSFALAVIYMQGRRRQQERQLRALELADIDRMDGPTFERYVTQLLRAQGYTVAPTGHSGDLGVDIVARQSQLKYAVQVKRQQDPVSRRAVSDAVAGMARYGCNAAMVVTNNYFSPGAKELARANRCQLVDRDRLAKWVLEFQQSG